MRKLLFISVLLATSILFSATNTHAQQYKIRQETNVSGMKYGSTVYVKGMRKRTENSGMMSMATAPVVIEQCDLQRYVKLNDKKKLYLIEPFGKEDVIDEDAKPAAVKTKPVIAQPKEKTAPQQGGFITMWYNITDTGERKKINGFTARHIWTTQKIKPSPEACTMKDSLIIKTDGWYIDLPQFNCPVRYTPSTSAATEKNQPECKDRYVTKRSGKGKLGFPLTETRTIIMGNGTTQTSTFETSLETLEFSAEKLDSMLFEIPPGYSLAASENELLDKMDMSEMMNQYKSQANDVTKAKTDPTAEKKEGVIRIGVFEPKGDGQVQTPALQQQLASSLSGGEIEAMAIANEEQAKNFHCDYTLSTDITRIKAGSKVGGLLKAIKNTDPGASSSFTIDAKLTLISLADGSTRLQQTVSGKYDGKVDEAAKKALEDGSRQVIKGLK